MFKVEMLHDKEKVKGTYTVTFQHGRKGLGLRDWAKIHNGVAKQIQEAQELTPEGNKKIDLVVEREICKCIIFRKFEDEEGRPQVILETVAVCHPLEKRYDRKQARKIAFAKAVFQLFGGPIRGTKMRKFFNQTLFDNVDIENNGGLKAIRRMFWMSFFANITMPGFKRVKDFAIGYTFKKGTQGRELVGRVRDGQMK